MCESGRTNAQRGTPDATGGGRPEERRKLIACRERDSVTISKLSHGPEYTSIEGWSSLTHGPQREDCAHDRGREGGPREGAKRYSRRKFKKVTEREERRGANREAQRGSREGETQRCEGRKGETQR